DTAENAYADRGGYQVVVPGHPEQSELLRRVTSDDPDEHMPPPESAHERLSTREIDLLRRWIA
ncbi:MAG: hypothetical protein GWO24_22135, partial [Akkermansiaceae bacterium]|nr:hypothetical protein [Akkermansiaceae bacterium]